MCCAAAAVMGRAHVTLLKLSWQLRRSCRGTPAAAAAAQYNVASVPPPRPRRHNFLPIKVSPARRGPAAAVVSPPAAGPQQPAAEHCGRTAEAEAGFCGGCGAAGRSSCWAVRRLGRDIPGAPSVEQSECESSGVRSVHPSCRCCQCRPCVRPRTLVTVDCVRL